MLSKILKTKHIIRLGIVRKLKNSFSNKLIYSKLTDGIIVNAEQIKTELLKNLYLEKQKIAVIYNGVDTQNIDTIAKNYAALTENKFRIISIGSLIKRKRMDLVIESFAHFIKANNIHNAELYIVGEGKERNNLEKICSDYSITDFVKFTGFLDNPYKYLNLADVFILCSENEGISNAVLEAMYLKKVVISTNAGGIDYAIKNCVNGILINNDVKEIAEVFYKIYSNNKLRDTLALNANKTIIQKFSLSKMADDIENFIFNVN